MKYFLTTLICLSIYHNSIAQLVPFRVNNLFGYSDAKGAIKIEPQYQNASFFKNELAFVEKDSLFYLINTKGEQLAGGFKYHGVYNSGFCNVVAPDNRTYYIDTKGKEAFKELKNIEICENFSENLAVIMVNKKLGIINTKGEWVRKPDFDTSSRVFQSGFLLAVSNGKYFFINKKGQTMKLNDSIFPASAFSENMAAVYVKRKSTEAPFNEVYTLQYIDTLGNIVLNKFINEGLDYSEYISPEADFRDGKAIVKTRNDMGWDYYFIDKKGAFSPLYSFAKHLGDSLFLGMLGVYMPDVRILDKHLWVSGQFQKNPVYVGIFNSKLLPVQNKEKKWGYMDNNCKLIIDFLYEGASDFDDGYAFVFKNGVSICINKEGKEYYTFK